MTENSDKEKLGRDNRKVRVEYGIPALNFLGPAIDKIAPHVPFLAQIAAALFILLTGLFSFLGLLFMAPNIFSGFQTSFFIALVYGLFALLAAAALVFGYFDFVKRQTKDALHLDQASVGTDREVLAQYYAQKNRRAFYGNALFVAFVIIISIIVFWRFFGLYPNEVFYMPGLYLLAIWFVLIHFLSRLMVVLFGVILFVLRIVVVIMGPMVLLYMVPYLLTFPLFALMNFFMMFGPLAFINIMQIKKILPGEGRIDEGKKVLGQRQAMKQLEHALMLFISPEGEMLAKKGSFPPRGILMKGPPGVGKTLFAKTAASMLSCPIIIASGSAYIATFMGIDILVMLYTKIMTNALAREWGRAILFIDEADQLMMRRAGMTGNAPGLTGRAKDFWSLFNYDANGKISSCGLSFLNDDTREIIEERKNNNVLYVHPQMFPGMLGGMGMSMAIFPFLTWLDGVQSPPWHKSLIRNKINMFLDILLVVPLKWRLPPIESTAPKILFLAATNRPQVIDPALLREGRFGLHVDFIHPDEQGCEEIIRGYLPKVAHHPILATDEKIRELARTVRGLSPADIEQILRGAVSIHYTKVMRIKWLMAREECGEKFDELEQIELRNAKERILKEEKWDEVWATWDSIVESLATKRFGMAKPPPSTAEKQKNIIRLQKNTAYHELAGHLLTLYAFCRKFQKPTFVSVVERGESLGLLANVPLEEREDMVQWMMEGFMRVSIGSVAAERILLEDHDNGPGVSADLINVGSIAIRMATKWSMPPRKCKDRKEESRYEEIGEIMFSAPEVLYTELGGSNSLSNLMGFQRKKRNTLISIGQAYVDAWRVIKKNQGLIPSMVEKLVAKGELTGRDLEELWENLDASFTPLAKEDDADDNWPEMMSENKFYTGSAAQ